MRRRQPIRALDARHSPRESVGRRTGQKDVRHGRREWRRSGPAAGGAGRGRGRPRNPPAMVEGNTRTGGVAAAPQQNASESPAATVQKLGSIRQICWQNSLNAVLRACLHLQPDASPQRLPCPYASRCTIASADGPPEKAALTLPRKKGRQREEGREGGKEAGRQ